MDKKVTEGSRVTLHYTGKLEDGSIFDSSRDKEPLTIKIGKDEIIPGFAEGILNMAVGESKTFSINPDKGYGSYDAALVHTLDKKFLPPEIEPEVGMQLKIGQEPQIAFVTITKIQEDSVTLDANHPLAGKTVEFDVEILEIA